MRSFPRARMFSTGALLVVGALLLSACEEEKSVETPPVRSVKLLEVGQIAGNQVRRLSGVVEASTVSELAFEVSGRVIKLSRDIGETVVQGEIIAQLEQDSFNLRVRTAEANMTEAQAQRRDAQSKFKQQSTLFEKKFTTKTALDTAKANLETGISRVEAAQAELDLARRDLNKASLRAPFSGTIGARYVDVFSEISSGQRIYQLNSDGDNEVQVSVPESLIQELSIGDSIAIEFPTLAGVEVPGRITEIGTRATVANAFPVTIALDEQPEAIRPGMTAEVTFSFGSDVAQDAFLIPLAAVVAKKETTKGDIFVFDAENSTLEKREITVINVIDNDLEVIGPLQAGETIVIGGVSFLHDGMQVKQMTGKVR